MPAGPYLSDKWASDSQRVLSRRYLLSIVFFVSFIFSCYVFVFLYLLNSHSVGYSLPGFTQDSTYRILPGARSRRSLPSCSVGHICLLDLTCLPLGVIQPACPFKTLLIVHIFFVFSFRLYLLNFYCVGYSLPGFTQVSTNRILPGARSRR